MLKRPTEMTSASKLQNVSLITNSRAEQLRTDLQFETCGLVQRPLVENKEHTEVHTLSDGQISVKVERKKKKFLKKKSKDLMWPWIFIRALLKSKGGKLD